MYTFSSSFYVLNRNVFGPFLAIWYASILSPILCIPGATEANDLSVEATVAMKAITQHPNSLVIDAAERVSVNGKSLAALTVVIVL